MPVNVFQPPRRTSSVATPASWLAALPISDPALFSRSCCSVIACLRRATACWCASVAVIMRWDSCTSALLCASRAARLRRLAMLSAASRSASARRASAVPIESRSLASSLAVPGGGG
jgi:hypothetical protein